ncbi:MAG: replication factor C small subunit [Candidatus Aenigmatarchaeota archaeon]|nr:MAG: replication factor C small subunit [Candidatus Aenigmarchaeota archaeon]
MEVWTEKYRPKTRDEIVNQESIVSRLKAFVKSENLPNLLFAGPAGTGKTTASLCVARELFGENWRQNYMELNASDERGIDVIRNKVKNFARTRTLGKVPFKIISLDEADALTPEAQQALRRTMENYTNTCRFILICNYSSRIIDPIQSRCAVFRFSKLEREKVKELLKRIIKEEKLDITDDAIEAIIDIAQGDLRRVVNLLQSTAAMGKKITKDLVYEATAQARPEDIREMVQLSLNGKFEEARKKLYLLLVEKGVAGEDIIKGIHREIFDLDIDEKRKVELIEKVGEFEFRLNEGGDPQIQIEALLAQFAAS